MPLIGLRDTNSVLAEARPGDYMAFVLEFWRNKSPFMAMMKTSMNRSKATDPTKSFFQTDIPPMVVRINDAANYTDADTSIKVDDGAGNGMARWFRKGSALRYVGATMAGLGTSELMVVTTNPTDDNTLVVSRGYASTTPSALTNNDYLVIAGDAEAEGGLSPTPVYDEPAKEYNHIQIYRDSFQVTGQMKRTVTRFGEPEMERVASRSLWRHMCKQENDAFLGTRAEVLDTETNTMVRLQGGARYFVTTNVFDASTGKFGPKMVEAAMNQLWHGSPEKVAFCSQQSFALWQEYAKALGQFQLVPGQADFGFRLATLVTGGPTIHFMVHPLLSMMGCLDTFVVDTAYTFESYWEDVKKEAIPLANTAEHEKGQWRSERTICWGNEQAHAIFAGMGDFDSTK